MMNVSINTDFFMAAILYFVKKNDIIIIIIALDFYVLNAQL